MYNAIVQRRANRRESPNMNERHTDILRILYKNRSFITYGELAEMLDVSVGTVRNDIALLKEELVKANAGEIEARPHIGIRLISTEESLKKLKNNGRDDREIVFFIIRSLFKYGSLTAQRLQEKYYLGRTELEKILERTSDWFSEYHIVFQRRRGKGISIQSSEFNYRLALMNFCTQYTDMYSALINERSTPYTLISDRDYTAACAALDGFDAAPVVKAITDTENANGFKLDYMSSMRLLILISLSIVRSKRGYEAEIPNVISSPTDGTSDKMIADEITDRITASTGVGFSNREKSFIEFVISVSEIHEFESDRTRHQIEVLNTELCRFSVKLVNLISDIADVDLRDDKFFVRQLFLQLKVTISRLKYGITYKNPLLSRIKAKYPNMMAVAWLLENVFEKELCLDLNENEVGALALHIGGAIERHLAGITACIVCDYGIGISQILKEKISRAIPDLRITNVFSVRDMRKIKNEPCDFIITTIPLDSYRVDREIVTVGHLLDENDVKNLDDEMKKIRYRRRGGIKNISPKKSLFSKELIFPKYHVKSKNELLKMLCIQLENLGFVTADFEESVYEREKTTSTEIGKGFAVPHGLSGFVNRSAVAFASLDEPIIWNDEEEVDIVFLLAFDLDESEEMKSEIVNFYKSVVSFMEDEKKFQNLRQSCDNDEIIKIFGLW